MSATATVSLRGGEMRAAGGEREGGGGGGKWGGEPPLGHLGVLVSHVWKIGWGRGGPGRVGFEIMNNLLQMDSDTRFLSLK